LTAYYDREQRRVPASHAMTLRARPDGDLPSTQIDARQLDDTQIYEGTNQIQRVVMARQLLGRS